MANNSEHDLNGNGIDLSLYENWGDVYLNSSTNIRLHNIGNHSLSTGEKVTLDFGAWSKVGWYHYAPPCPTSGYYEDMDWRNDTFGEQLPWENYIDETGKLVHPSDKCSNGFLLQLPAYQEMLKDMGYEVGKSTYADLYGTHYISIIATDPSVINFDPYSYFNIVPRCVSMKVETKAGERPDLDYEDALVLQDKSDLFGVTIGEECADGNLVIVHGRLTEGLLAGYDLSFEYSEVLSGGIAVVYIGLARYIEVAGGMMYSTEDAPSMTWFQNCTVYDNGVIGVTGESSASNITISDGGYLEMISGGGIWNSVIEDGGTVRVTSGGIVGITVNAGGTLLVDGGMNTLFYTPKNGDKVSLDLNAGGYCSIEAGCMAGRTFNVGGRLEINGQLYSPASGYDEIDTLDLNLEAYELTRNNTTALLSGFDFLPWDSCILTIKGTTAMEAGSYLLADGVGNTVFVNVAFDFVDLDGEDLFFRWNSYYGAYEGFSCNGMKYNLLVDDQLVLQVFEDSHSSALPDIVLQTASIGDGELETSETATVNFTVCNTGKDTAQATFAYINFGDERLGQVKIDALKAGAVTHGSFTIDTKYLKGNPDQLTISLDAQQALVERNEYNNVLSVVLADDMGGIVWRGNADKSTLVEYSFDNFQSSFCFSTDGNSVDLYALSQGTWQWRIKCGDDGFWQYGDNITSQKQAAADIQESDGDGQTDLFFANAKETWQTGYAAEHHGSLYGWEGTLERVMLFGKNKISDVFVGSDDANILVLTDDSNGDALFVEDIYTSFGKDAVRISQIDEIHAGAGNDLIDMTSQKFAYSEEDVKIYGGLGDDTIWASHGDNILFGDAGNDRLVGSSGSDVIIGGSGNDSMCGGGGYDIFCFGGNWGNDTVELKEGYVLLWFEEGAESNWDAAALTYTDGANKVKVIGKSADNIALRFGGNTSNLPDGCFADAASEKIFESNNKGILA